VDGSEDATRVIGKESVSGTDSGLGGEGRENRFNMISKSQTQSMCPGLRLNTAQYDNLVLSPGIQRNMFCF